MPARFRPHSYLSPPPLCRGAHSICELCRWIRRGRAAIYIARAAYTVIKSFCFWALAAKSKSRAQSARPLCCIGALALCFPTRSRWPSTMHLTVHVACLCRWGFGLLPEAAAMGRTYPRWAPRSAHSTMMARIRSHIGTSNCLIPNATAVAICVAAGGLARLRGGVQPPGVCCPRMGPSAYLSWD